MPVDRQLPLDFGHTPGLSRDDLVVSAANRAAVEALERWPRWPSPIVILAGPAGSGKTHLATIWRVQTEGRTVAAASIAQEAGNAGKAIAIDDIDAGPVDEAALFHLINAVRENDASLLMTARRFPAAWGVRLADLASRLKAATVVEIGEPDDTLLGGVLTKLFADRQVEVDPAVVQFLVRRMERSLSTASAIVDRLDRVAMERKSPITRALAGELITAMDVGQGSFDLGG